MQNYMQVNSGEQDNPSSTERADEQDNLSLTGKANKAAMGGAFAFAAFFAMSLITAFVGVGYSIADESGDNHKYRLAFFVALFNLIFCAAPSGIFAVVTYMTCGSGSSLFRCQPAIDTPNVGMQDEEAAAAEATTADDLAL